MTIISRFAAAALATLIAFPALAQQEAPAEFADAEIQAFAEAAVEITELRQAWTPRLEAAESQEEIAQLQQQANMEMATAVQNSGISVETYNQIAMALESDPELGSKVQQYLEEVR